MSRKIPIVVKRGWLDDYEGGKSVATIAKANRRDTRTVKKGIEEARRERDIRIARTELVKGALQRHHNNLLEELQQILSLLRLPPEDAVPLSWHRGTDSIFPETPRGDQGRAAVAADASAREAAAGNVGRGLLGEHLKGDRIWKLLARQREDASRHLASRIDLQRKTVTLLEEKTGYKVVDRAEASPPFLYSYTAGDLLFKAARRRAFGIRDTVGLEADIVAEAARGYVTYHSSILAEAPGGEEVCRGHLIEALRELLGVPELSQVALTYRQLEESTAKARQAIEQLLALGLVPGQCTVCRRLGV